MRWKKRKGARREMKERAKANFSSAIRVRLNERLANRTHLSKRHLSKT